MILRRFAEYLSRGRRHTRRLPAEVGGLPIVVSPEAGGLKYWTRTLDTTDVELLRLAREFVRPGFTVWDVGANQGIFTFAAAWLAGQAGAVVAIEPDVWLATLLSKSCALNAHAARAPVTIVPLAASGVVGLSRLNIAKRARASNYLEGFGNNQTGGVRQSLPILTVTLDWLAEYLPAPQVIKIDVEGAELSVLRGAMKLLLAHRPALICETNAQNSVEAAGLLRALGFAIYDGEAKPDERLSLSACPWSTLALPAETEASLTTAPLELSAKSGA